MRLQLSRSCHSARFWYCENILRCLHWQLFRSAYLAIAAEIRFSISRYGEVAADCGSKKRKFRRVFGPVREHLHDSPTSAALPEGLRPFCAGDGVLEES